MPKQTTKTGYVKFPDGGKVSVKESGGSWFDIGAINSPVNFTLTFDENIINTANAGELPRQVRNMRIDAGLTLINLIPEGIEKMGGDIFTRETVTGSTVVDADITDQTIDGFTDGKPVELDPVVTSTGNTLRFSTDPVIASVTASTSGALTAGDDYHVFQDDNATSGYSILFDTAGTATVGTGETITVDFGDNDPIASESIFAGTTTEVLTAYGLKCEHIDENDQVDRSFEIYSANPTSGGFQFNFKGANEDGVEEMPLTFQGSIDTSRANGKQLFEYYTKN